MIDKNLEIIERTFDKRDSNGMWKEIPTDHKYYPIYMHYVPNFKASLWVLIMLADLNCNPLDERIQRPLNTIKDHLFDADKGIYSLKEDHFPIPCLNGNMLYLDNYFNGKPDNLSLSVLDFFSQYQRFDDGEYSKPKNQFCSNKSCYGKHTCYWGVVKLLKGISFIPRKSRNKKITFLKDNCINFILKHNVCFSSHAPEKIMINKLDKLTFPNFYKSDFLEILWLLKREKVHIDSQNPAIKILKEKRNVDGTWNLERKMNNLITTIGPLNKPNFFITKRATEVLDYYG